jgi:spore coat protein A
MKSYKTRFAGMTIGALAPLGLWAGCSADDGNDATAEQAVGRPSADQVPLDPLAIPKFAHDLPIPRVFAPTVITSGGQVVRHEYTVSIAQTLVQMLPPEFPQTNVLAYGGQVKIPGSSATEFVRSTPGSVFDNTRGIPTSLHWRNEISQPHFLPIDPTLHWANPQTIEPPTAPFNPFPPGYKRAQFPVGFVTHTHGLVVRPDHDGTAEEWFTPFEQRGPSFRTRDYDIPNEQSSTQLFYHDHTMGMTRVNVYAGVVGSAYFIRDPNAPLDQPSSPLPQGEFEIPLTFFSRAFFTDGELNFPREAGDPPADTAYWQGEDEADTNLVNGKVWPNLNVQRRQYRFRMLAADNVRVYNIQLSHNGSFVPFTIIGADGGYLPAPLVSENVQIGITERADILVDFSQFAPGTQIIMENNTPGVTEDTTGILMRFTVEDSPVVAPPPLPADLFPARPELPTNAPARIKTLIRFVDEAETSRMRSLDGLMFTTPATEFPLVGSTEEWVLVHTGEEEEEEEEEGEPDADLGFHQIHLHLIEFQVLNRQPFDRTAYLQQWNLLNGHRPRSRQIVLDPTPFFTGPPVPPEPVETGWKDTVQTPPEVVTRIIVRWAPQEVPTGGVSPGQNLFPFDPTAFPGDPFTGPGYPWHCHLLGHEDRDMMRPNPLVNLWTPGTSYEAGNVIALNNINYRARVTHTSQAGQPPNTDFDLWDRANNNDGSWQPQIRYAVDDRVLHDGQLFRALQVHQSQPGQTPPNNPALWDELPMTACGQLAEFCADDAGSQVGAECLALGQAGDEAACLGEEAEGLMACLSVCEFIHPSPCSGLCNNPVVFTVPDNRTFRSGDLGTDATCHETTSELLSGTCSSFSAGRQLTVNGRVMPCGSGNWPYPLPPQRNDGYCIQTTAGNQPWAAFATW